MSNAYTPLPGTIPARVLAFFRGPGFGRELATGVLADELGLESGSLTASLAVPLKHGALERENRGGLNYWKLGAGQLVHAVGDQDEPDDEAPVQRVVRAAPGDSVSLLDIPRFPGVVVKAAPPKPAPRPQQAPKGAPREASGPYAKQPLGWLMPPSPPAAPSGGPPFIDPDEAFAKAPPSQPNPATPASPGPAPAADVPAAITAQSGDARQPGPGACGAPSSPTEAATASQRPATAKETAHRGAVAGAGDDANCDGGESLPPADTTRPMRCAVWSDGTLAIEKDGQTQTYTPEETRAIVRYLERVLVGEGAE